jgi:hypothetical protein
MSEEFFKVPKQEKSVSLWVHPEGRVLGAIYIREQSLHHAGEETPAEVLSQVEPFVVVRRDDLGEYRFYNKSSIVRLQYEAQPEGIPYSDTIECEMHMMDGSLISGEIRGAFPPDQRRLYDHLNQENDAFIPLHLDSGQICLINKNYIIYAKSL